MPEFTIHDVVRRLEQHSEVDKKMGGPGFTTEEVLIMARDIVDDPGATAQPAGGILVGEEGPPT